LTDSGNGSVSQGQQERKASNRYALGMVLTLSASALWGSTYPAIKFDLLYINPFEITLFRTLFASLSLFAYLGYTKKIWYFPRDIKIIGLLLFASFLGATGFWTFLNLSVLFVDPDTSSFLVALYPLIAVVMASAFLGEKATIGRALGVMLGIFGSIIIVSFGRSVQIVGTNPFLGEVSAILSALSWAGYMLISKVLMGMKDSKTRLSISPEYITFMTFILAILPTFLIAGLATDPPWGVFTSSPAGLGIALYLGVVASAFAFLIFNIGMKYIGVSRAAVNQLLFPGVALLLTYVLLGEIINIADVTGIVLIIIGVVVAQINGINRVFRVSSTKSLTS
jgi:drug/metabolite transporter (DMT)-like permease